MIITAGQNICDVAIQCYGSLESLFSFLIANDLTLSDSLYAGQEVSIVEVAAEQSDVLVRNYLSGRQLRINTGTPPDLGAFSISYSNDFD